MRSLGTSSLSHGLNPRVSVSTASPCCNKSLVHVEWQIYRSVCDLVSGVRFPVNGISSRILMCMKFVSVSCGMHFAEPMSLFLED